MELTEEQRQSLALFREVTAEARDEASSIEVLKSCNWNVGRPSKWDQWPKVSQKVSKSREISNEICCKWLNMAVPSAFLKGASSFLEASGPKVEQALSLHLAEDEARRCLAKSAFLGAGGPGSELERALGALVARRFHGRSSSERPGHGRSSAATHGSMVRPLRA